MLESKASASSPDTRAGTLRQCGEARQTNVSVMGAGVEAPRTVVDDEGGYMRREADREMVAWWAPDVIDEGKRRQDLEEAFQGMQRDNSRLGEQADLESKNAARVLKEMNGATENLSAAEGSVARHKTKGRSMGRREAGFGAVSGRVGAGKVIPENSLGVLVCWAYCPRVLRSESFGAVDAKCDGRA
ncbi:hypothetical protein CYMTET_33258, partial [Cymbomonas tetramitiformis]